jgi:hypothetical protein
LYSDQPLSVILYCPIVACGGAFVPHAIKDCSQQAIPFQISIMPPDLEVEWGKLGMPDAVE